MPRPNKDVGCGNCEFYESLENFSQCRRYPPKETEYIPTLRDIDSSKRWRQVFSFEWCGEYKAKGS